MPGLLLFLAPGIALLLTGFFAAQRPQTRWPQLWAVVVAGAVAWLTHIALMPFEEGSDTFFGTTPVFDNDEAYGLVPLALMVPVCAIAGWRRVAQPIAIGAAAVAVPLALAYSTTPRGDGDGLWTLIFLMLPAVGFLLAGVATTAAAMRGSSTDVASVAARRATACVIDVALIFATVLIATETTTSDAVALAALIGVSALLYAAPVAVWSATIGHRTVGLRVTTADGDRPIGAARACGRALLILIELVASVSVVPLLPALVDFVVTERTGLSFADRLTGTRVQLLQREGLLPLPREPGSELAAEERR